MDAIGVRLEIAWAALKEVAHRIWMRRWRDALASLQFALMMLGRAIDDVLGR